MIEGERLTSLPFTLWLHLKGDSENLADRQEFDLFGDIGHCRLNVVRLAGIIVATTHNAVAIQRLPVEEKAASVTLQSTFIVNPNGVAVFQTNARGEDIKSAMFTDIVKISDLDLTD